jgi:hypothetical protein
MKLVDQDGKGTYHPCDYYNWRLDWLERTISKRHNRGDKLSTEQYQQWYEAEKRTYENHLKDYSRIEKLNKEVGIIVPTHKYHNMWLETSLKQCNSTGYWTLLAFDNPFYQLREDIAHVLPSVQAFMYADQVIMKPKTWGSGVGVPHSWSMWMGLMMIKNLGFPYVFNVNGDIVLEKPEGVSVLLNMLKEEDADIIACEYHKDRYLGTMIWLSKTDAALQMWEMNMKKLYQINFGNAEARMGKFAKQLNLKVIPVDNPKESHFKDWTYDSTFRRILGIRHLHAEHKDRRKRKDEPVEEKYCDKRYLNQHEKKTLVEYWKTKDKKYLKAWWK